MNLKFLFVITLFLLSFNSCKKEDETIPLVAVNISININDPEYLKLANVTGWEYLTGGSRGILVYRKSTNEFMAYERNCTYEPSSTCARVFVDSSNVLAVDSCCGSQFVITDGSVAKGPATLPLKQYNTSFSGSQLRIFN